MLTAKIVAIAASIAFAAIVSTGCQSSTSSPQALEKERVAITGSQPPADAGAKYLSSHGNDPAAIKAKVDAAGAAFQNRKK
jgi:hypothetical protein